MIVYLLFRRTLSSLILLRMGETVLIRFVKLLYCYTGSLVAHFPRSTIVLSLAFTAIISLKINYTPQVSSIDGFAGTASRSRLEYNVFQEFLNTNGEGITLGILLKARDGGSMIRLDYLNNTIQLLDLVSTGFLMHDYDLGRNESFNQFCRGFCQVNEPIRQFFIGMNILSTNNSDSLAGRIDLSYPSSTMFGRKFSLLPNFFGVKMNKDGHNIDSVSLLVLYFRAEKHLSWSKDMVKQWEIAVEDHLSREYTSRNLEIFVFSPSIVEREIVRAGMSLQPFLAIGFLIMCIFCTSTTILSAVGLHRQKLSVYKIILAIIACLNPFMACGVGLGGLFLFGVTFSPILCITPFLVLAISVDDSFLMLHAWNRINTCNITRLEKISREQKISEVLVQTGPAITISAFTNILAFIIGALTSPPEIRVFCIGNAACIFMDMIFQATFYAAAMTLFADDAQDNIMEKKWLKKEMRRVLKFYVNSIASLKISLCIILIWIFYIIIATIGLLQVKVDLSPQKLFLEDSPIIEIDRLRSAYVVPYFTPATVLINNPGDLENEATVQKLIEMKSAFEHLPNAIGPESTKFFLDDFTSFKEMLSGGIKENSGNYMIESFLRWPEFSFWEGFMKLRNGTGGQLHVDKFFFTTGFHGEKLHSWNERGRLLKAWRSEADRYTEEFNVTVFSDDAFYLDLLEVIPSITSQSMLVTFICMVIICALFISDFSTISVVSITILTTCLGVFGYLSLLGLTLDPIMMSISIMCLGFSVDIPAHISFHFFSSKSSCAARGIAPIPYWITSLENEKSQTSCSTPKHSSTIEDSFKYSLAHTLSSVGYPVLQAGISTNLCALPLAFVNLYMAQVFSCSLILCVSLSLIHGLVIIPALFSLQEHIIGMTNRKYIYS